MSKEFTIKYKSHYHRPYDSMEDIKEEIVIDHTGCIRARRFDHHGPDNHYRITERASGSASAENTEQLYKHILDLFYTHADFETAEDDLDTEVVLTEPGINLSMDGSVSNGKITCITLIEEFLKTADISWDKPEDYKCHNSINLPVNYTNGL